MCITSLAVMYVLFYNHYSPFLAVGIEEPGQKLSEFWEPLCRTDGSNPNLADNFGIITYIKNLKFALCLDPVRKVLP